MQSILYHNSSGAQAFTGNLKKKEVHRAITLHPVKSPPHMYRLHNYMRVGRSVSVTLPVIVRRGRTRDSVSVSAGTSDTGSAAREAQRSQRYIHDGRTVGNEREESEEFRDCERRTAVPGRSSLERISR